MSKLSFRARHLDASKSMPVYLADEIPDMPDFAAINRAVPQMPTGMEKEEESEHHLQRALSAQQVYGTAEALVIPVPENQGTGAGYQHYEKKAKEFKPPKQYIHVQPFGMDQEIPDYDMDSEDETWLNKQAKNLKMEVTALKFENMMDRLEKGSGQTVVSLQDAKALLKEDDDLIIAVYDYWLNKRLRLQHALIPTVKTEKRDGSTTNNPYVAFRRRTEKMQTRKNRKNDEASYEKMLKLRRDLNRALTILEMIKRREKSKKELLQLTIEIVDKRHQMKDWEGKSLAEALAQRHKLQSFVSIPSQYMANEWRHKSKLMSTSQDEGGFVRKKREYKKRKHKQATQHQTSSIPPTAVTLPQYADMDTAHPSHDGFSTDDEPFSPVPSQSDQEQEDDPDGVYAFRRKEGCIYHAPILDGQGNWPWCGAEDRGMGQTKYRYSLSSLSHPHSKCLGFVRRRVGRGGRVYFDRGFSEWDDELHQLDFNDGSDTEVSPYTSYIKQNNINVFRPRGSGEDESGQALLTGWGAPVNPPTSPTPLLPSEFSAESFHSHQEQLLQMQRQQQEEALKRETDAPLADLDASTSYELDSGFSQLNSRFTLDSATAQFAASAVCSSTQDLLQQGTRSTDSPLLVTPTTLSTLTSESSSIGGGDASLPLQSLTSTADLLQGLQNGPVLDSKSSGFSTSPAANVLQLNYPLTLSTTLDSLTAPPAPVSTTTTNCVVQSPAVSASSVTLTPVAGSGLLAVTSSNPSGAAGQKVVSPNAATILKIGTGAVNNKNSTITVNHEPVNNLVQEKGLPMEVT